MCPFEELQFLFSNARIFCLLYFHHGPRWRFERNAMNYLQDSFTSISWRGSSSYLDMDNAKEVTTNSIHYIHYTQMARALLTPSAELSSRNLGGNSMQMTV